MANWTTADIVILGVVAFIAMTALVRLMLHRRDELLSDLEEQARGAKAKKAAEEASTK
ncbi:MAG: hypothetical protein WD894_18665 [Pirellulales bacterium]